MTEQSVPPHISNINNWGGHPDRNYYVFVVLSVLFGFFGLDHFYLRSFETGFKKLLVNVFGFGLWYVWDIIQIATDGVKIREEGLTSPLDWIRGIGHGAFIPPFQKSDKQESFSARKSYLLYAFLAIFLGCFGFDKFYMGYGWQGLAKLLSCFNIFLFLFGWLWVFWDSFHAFFMTKSILDNGISPPMPYSFVFDPIPSDDFKTSQATATQTPGNFLDWIAITFGFPPVPTLLSAREAYKDIVAPLLTVPMIKTLQTVGSGMPEVPSVAMPSMPSVTLPEVPAMPSVALPQAPAMPSVALPAMPSVAMPTALNNASWNTKPTATPLKPEAEQKVAFAPTMAQHGGGSGQSGPGPVIAGALTAVVLAGGLKGFYDFISAQYG